MTTPFKIGKYQVLGTLGKGAHSTILHIRRSADSKHYALKVVPISGSDEQKYLEQACHEFEVAQRFDHPHLIKLFALETQRNLLFRVRQVQLLIEYVNGKTLDTFPRLSLPRLVQIFARVAAGLKHMHRRGVCHADLKPNNILLSKAGEVKVIDYGLAWIKGQLKDRVQGTPEYMAPEQAKMKFVNEQTDIYNFGATMYRLVTWQFPPNSLAQAGIALNNTTWKRLLKPVDECAADVPRELSQLIERCLAFNPGERPERVSDIIPVLGQLEKTLVASPDDRLEAIEW